MSTKIEKSKELEEKYPDGENFLAQYRQGKIIEPLLEQAQSHLSKALNLPDEFPIRERVLYELPKAEFIMGNYEKALSLLDELSTKYPKGKYGKRSSSAKAELLELQKRELAQAPQPWVSGLSRLLPLFLVIAAGIVLIGLILVLKKKAGSRGK